METILPTYSLYTTTYALFMGEWQVLELQSDGNSLHELMQNAEIIAADGCTYKLHNQLVSSVPQEVWEKLLRMFAEQLQQEHAQKVRKEIADE